MNRKELVDSIQKHTSVARADVDKVLGSLIQHTQVAVKKGERVALVGFGTFERQDRKARTARNPRSGAPVKVKATKVPRFRAGQGFKDVVAGKATAPKLTPAEEHRQGEHREGDHRQGGHHRQGHRLAGQHRQGLDGQEGQHGQDEPVAQQRRQARQEHGQGRQLAWQGQERQEEVAPQQRRGPATAGPRRFSGAVPRRGGLRRGRAG